MGESEPTARADEGAKPRPLALALAQAAGRGGLEANLSHVRACAAEAMERDDPPALMVFPECFLTGYKVPDPKSAAVTAAEAADKLGGIAAKAGAAIVAGFIERAGGALHNSAVAVDAKGECLVTYRKRCLFGEWEQDTFRPGDRAGLLTLGGWRVGLCVCYDIEFPEIGRELALAGTRLIVTPTALMRPYGAEILTLVHARAIENGIHVGYANRVGSELDLAYVGESRIVNPDGKVVAHAPGDSEQVVHARLEPDECIGGQLPDLKRFLSSQ